MTPTSTPVAVAERTTVVTGSATPEGTRAYRDRFDRSRPDAYSSLSGLHLSSVGIGTYLGDHTDAVDARYRQSLLEAVGSGINVIDTASVYRGGRSELVVGQMLRDIVATHAREELFITTKGGFLQVPPTVRSAGEHLAFLQRTYIETGRCEWGDIAEGQHCLRPSFIDGEVDRSRAALGLQTIDLYLLHNPETHLRSVERDRAMQRIAHALAVLERRCLQGDLRYYGVATWEALTADEGDERSHLSLEALVTLAQSVGGTRHHFRAVEMPLNPTQSGAFLQRTQRVGGEALTAVEAARRLGLYVLTSRTIDQGRVDVPFADEFYDDTRDLITDTQRLLQFARSLPGVGTALVGTKRRARAREAALVMAQPRLTTAQVSLAVASLLLQRGAA
jgi:aryl-alcohol dehydrogenase-like predicted oxidoreductase